MYTYRTWESQYRINKVYLRLLHFKLHNKPPAALNICKSRCPSLTYPPPHLPLPPTPPPRLPLPPPLPLHSSLYLPPPPPRSDSSLLSSPPYPLIPLLPSLLINSPPPSSFLLPPPPPSFFPLLLALLSSPPYSFIPRRLPSPLINSPPSSPPLLPSFPSFHVAFGCCPRVWVLRRVSCSSTIAVNLTPRHFQHFPPSLLLRPSHRKTPPYMKSTAPPLRPCLCVTHLTTGSGFGIEEASGDDAHARARSQEAPNTRIHHWHQPPPPNLPSASIRRPLTLRATWLPTTSDLR